MSAKKEALEAATNDEVAKKSPRRKIVTKHVPAQKPAFTAGVIIAVVLIGGVVILIIVAALTYKGPNADQLPNTTSPATSPTTPTPTGPPTTPPPKILPPPIGLEWVGQGNSGMTSFGSKYELTTQWDDGKRGEYKSIRVKIKLIETVSGRGLQKDGTLQIGLFQYLQPFATFLLERYTSLGVDYTKEGTDPLYNQNGIQWKLLADMRSMHYLDKKAPNGQPIPVATPTLIATFTNNPLTTIPPGTISFVMNNIF